MTESPKALPAMGGGFTLLKKGLLLAALPFVFQLIFIGMMVRERGESREAESWFVHTKEVIAQAQAAYATLIEAHNAVRGFTASNDPIFREDFNQAARKAPQALEALTTLVRDNPPQQLRARKIGERAADFLAWLEQTELTGRDGRGAAAPGITREGRTRLNDIRQEMDAFLKEEEILDEKRHQVRDRAWVRVDQVILGGTLATLLVMGMLAYAFGRGVSRRFAVLADNARRLAEGHELAAPLSGGDEITQMDHIFHRMAATLREAARKEREYTIKLEQRAADLDVANRELQEFASVASHDLQEPLRKIQAFGDRLHTRCAQGLGENGLDYLARMQNAASRMQTLINDLLAFSRVTTKAKPFEPVDLNQIAREVVSDLEGRLQQTGGQVELEELPTLDADPTQMRQLLQNLIGNALKFHRPDQSPIVRVRGRIVSEPDAEAMCEIQVEDNGIGFDEKYLDRIFNVFQRLHGRNEFDGAGMGLAICRKIVERHRGRITARSAPDQGATFLVTLPAAHASFVPQGASDE